MNSDNSFDYEKSVGLGARKTVGAVIDYLCSIDETIVVAYADVGSRFGVINNKNGYQISIAEQTLVGILGGMAHEGLKPFGIAYAPFLVYRALDQIRMTVGEMNLPIVLIGGSSGVASGNLGAASMALEDISIMRSIPNVIVDCPSDECSIIKSLINASNADTPCYIRLTGGNRMHRIYKKSDDYVFGKCNLMFSNGNDVIVYSVGSILSETIKAAKKIADNGVKISVYDAHTIKPFDVECVVNHIDCKAIVTVEEHNIVGGLGSVVSDIIAEKSGPKVLKLGIDTYYPKPDSYENILNKYWLNCEGIASKILSFIKQ